MKFNTTSLRNVLILLITAFPFLLSAQSQGLDEKINEAFMPVADWWDALVFTSISVMGFSVPLVLILLLSGALFFTIYFKFVNITKFPLALKVVRGKFDELEKGAVKDETLLVNTVDGDIVDTIKDEGHQGEVNHFQALATAVSGTVGFNVGFYHRVTKNFTKHAKLEVNILGCDLCAILVFVVVKNHPFRIIMNGITIYTSNLYR